MRHQTSGFYMVWNDDGIGCREIWAQSPIDALYYVWMDTDDTKALEPTYTYNETSIQVGDWYVYKG